MTAALSLAVAVCGASWMASPAGAAAYTPPPGKVFAGLTAGSSIVPFEDIVGHHPPVFERFMVWDANTDGLAARHSALRTRLAVALTTAVARTNCWRVSACSSAKYAKYVRPVISSEGIARGRSDMFLVAMNKNIAHSGRIVYVRIMAEMNGWWNPYCPYNKNGSSRGKAFSQHFFIEAWRRTVLILRGGPVRKIDRRLHKLGLPPINVQISRSAVLPRPKVAFMWVPDTRGDPGFSSNLPRAFWPGRDYVDWVGTDFYSPWPNFKWLTPFYNRFSGKVGKPFVLAEWGVEGHDNPKFVRTLFAWVRRRRRVRMLNYYQGYGSRDPFNPIHYPRSMAVLRHELASPEFPQYAPEYQGHPSQG